MDIIAAAVLAFAAICSVCAVWHSRIRHRRQLNARSRLRRVTTIRRNYGLKQRQGF